jgi:hypothetical protein
MTQKGIQKRIQKLIQKGEKKGEKKGQKSDHRNQQSVYKPSIFGTSSTTTESNETDM